MMSFLAFFLCWVGLFESTLFFAEKKDGAGKEKSTT